MEKINLITKQEKENTDSLLFEHKKTEAVFQNRDAVLGLLGDESKKFEISKEKIATVEEKVKEISGRKELLYRFLSRFGYKSLAIEKIDENLFEIPILKTDYEKIGDEYGYKGGMARAILLRELGIDSEAKARDVDIVKVIGDELNEKDRYIAEKYMEDDLISGGYGVELIEDDYFSTRDFTINEVLVSGDSIKLTKECLLDTIRGIVRFADFEKKEPYNLPQEFENGFFVKNKLMAKAVRLVAEAIARGQKREIADKDVYNYICINDFHIALHLDRALEQGKNVAVEYIKKLIEIGYFKNWEDLSPKNIIRDFIKYFNEQQKDYDKPFVFRYAPKNIIEDEFDFVVIKDGTEEKEIRDDFGFIENAEKDLKVYEKWEEYDR